MAMRPTITKIRMDASNYHDHHFSDGWIYQGRQALEGGIIWTGGKKKDRNTQAKEGMCLTEDSQTAITH